MTQLNGFSIIKMVHQPQNISLKKVLVAELKFGFLLLICICSGQSTETTRTQLVTAMVGDDVVLPCHLEVPLKADELEVEWGRLDLNPRFVHQWFEGSENNDDQNIVYKGRTSLFTDRLKDGDASLRLKGVKHSDNGRFRCYDAKKIDIYFVDLLVGSISLPGIGLAALDESKNGVKLDCSSAGWYPEPEIFWLDGEGNIMSAGPTENLKGPDGLYSISSRVTVEKRHNNNITCRVQQKDINQTREKHIYIQDGLFVPPSNCSVSVSFSVIFGLILLFGVAAFIWKWRLTKKSMKELKDEMKEEKHQLLKEEKDLVAMKKSDLEKDLKKRNQDVRSIAEHIEVLMKMSKEQKEQKEQLTAQRLETEEIIKKNENTLNAVYSDIENHRESRMDKRAQGFLKLREIITESNEILTKHVEFTPEKLIEGKTQEVKKLKERKQEIENHVVEIEKELKEMEEKISQLRQKPAKFSTPR
ncbi:butyrophilin subfamily 3 member A2-like [Cyprinodon tularosa]|uniref:butyrophilin subfamily 3 member A2-like n=1 Tax=Cyprinodon tularosa TaxID=77115 RepID=UPI0018E2124A|nr:butyrophilin subfamily 3 member A2-like [Cyprinodon tularosa]